MPDPVTILEIDLRAIVANWRDLAARHAGDTAAVVKADGYGLGATAVARALYQAGCRHFFVATPDEAAPLRDVVGDSFLAVLNGLFPGAARDYAALDIVPVIGSLDELAEWRDQKKPAALHVDTGMNRLGFDRRAWARLAGEPALLNGMTIRYAMTHLAASDRPEDPMNRAQRTRFKAALAVMPGVATSIANSSAMFMGEEFASDLARPGAALYGINPTPAAANPMRNVVRLKARVLQVRDVPAGETVGYNGCWRAARASRIATVPVGYADGYARSLANRGIAHFDGEAVPLVGRVSMDLTTFDITDHPAIGTGSWIELIGADNPPDALAVAAGTNGYEIMTSLGSRYHRRYLGG